ncbi:hypothetical protein NDU88_001613 [Pleurodeles waltl]|uniref:Uncharacterized protein n=1 Tax=Pleurodeles waltl TaxID=8319 RepID=A0AAV7UX87_PLEWA|nr:hypothetical protein NDU88_001613 [Pleurodeles waltl]
MRGAYLPNVVPEIKHAVQRQSHAAPASCFQRSQRHASGRPATQPERVCPTRQARLSPARAHGKLGRNVVLVQGWVNPLRDVVRVFVDVSPFGIWP